MTRTDPRAGPAVRSPRRVAIGLAVLLTMPAAAPQPARAAGAICGEREALVAQLAQRYGERPAGLGITQGGLLLELLVGPAGSWTILVTPPEGASCLAAAGRDWQRRDDDEQQEESGT